MRNTKPVALADLPERVKLGDRTYYVRSADNFWRFVAYLLDHAAKLKRVRNEGTLLRLDAARRAA